tara:strand:- start:11664 stop:12419 length:756 start_codon:yes stop_codon:yes gene_type:complete
MLYYSVAHYYDVDLDTHYRYGTARGKNKYKNIESHINVLKKLDIKDKAFVLTSTINAEKGDKRYEEVKNELYNFCKKLLPNNEIYVIVTYNWGGTIAALWNAYKLLKGKEGYLAHFEEDFGPLNNKWYVDSINILNNTDVVYVGESTTGNIKKGNDDGRLYGYKYKNVPRLGNPEVWGDGGYYFSNLKNLEIIENKIGIFHKGDKNTKYVNLIDGISFGEVGFPTLIYHAKLKFKVLKRSEYFNNEWNDNL